MDSTNGKKILSAISDLEDEIGSFGDAVAGMIDANKDDCFLKAKTPSKMVEEQDDLIEAASLVNQIDLKNTTRFSEDIHSLAANLSSLKNELDGLKNQLAKHTELISPQPPSASVQTDLAEQIGRLVNYLERKFGEINSHQQLLFSTNQTREDQRRLNNMDERSAWFNGEANIKPPRKSVSSFFSPEATEQSDENSIKELGDHYARFLNELRDDCVKRIKDAIAIESEKIIGRDDLSLKELFDVITYIIEKEKARFQNTLRDINERIFLALDDRVEQEQISQAEPEPVERNEAATGEIVKQAPASCSVSQDSLEPKNGRKQLLKQMNEIQKRLNNNLIKQYQFYGSKKN